MLLQKVKVNPARHVGGVTLHPVREDDLAVCHAGHRIVTCLLTHVVSFREPHCLIGGMIVSSNDAGDNFGTRVRLEGDP